MAEQPADNASGRLGHRGAAHIVASKQDQAMSYAHDFMSEKGLMRSQGVSHESQQSTYADSSHPATMASPQNLHHAYNNDVEYQRHSVGTEAMEEVRTHVQKMQQDHQEALTTQTQDILLEGHTNKTNVMQQQEKGVVRRLGSRGMSEVKGLAKDSLDAVKKLIPSESQQK
jgi:hypothetical protein